MISGFSTNISLLILDKTKDKQIEVLTKQPMHKRSIEHFKENIANVQNVDDLVDDYKTYSFVMKAFGLEDQIFGKAMMKKILSSDITDKKSLINRLTDPRFREIYKYMNFQDAGKSNPNVTKDSWQEGIINKYLEVQFENNQYEQNPSVGMALYFERKAPGINNWYQVLADKELSGFMRTALGIPESMATTPIEKQKALFEDKYDITKLKSPYEVDKLQTRFAAMYDAQNAGNTAATFSPSNILLNSALNSGFFAPITIDITSIGFNKIGALSRFR